MNTCTNYCRRIGKCQTSENRENRHEIERSAESQSANRERKKVDCRGAGSCGGLRTKQSRGGGNHYHTSRPRDTHRVVHTDWCVVWCTEYVTSTTHQSCVECTVDHFRRRLSRGPCGLQQSRRARLHVCTHHSVDSIPRSLSSSIPMILSLRRAMKPCESQNEPFGSAARSSRPQPSGIGGTGRRTGRPNPGAPPPQVWPHGACCNRRSRRTSPLPISLVRDGMGGTSRRCPRHAREARERVAALGGRRRHRGVLETKFVLHELVELT